MPFTRPNLSQVKTTTTAFDDPIIELNAALAGTTTGDIGIVMNRGTSGNNVGIFWDKSAQQFAMVQTTADGDSSGNLVFSAFSDLQVNTLSTANFTLPAADGTDGQILETDGMGVLSWVTSVAGGDSNYIGFQAGVPVATGAFSLAMGHTATSSGLRAISIGQAAKAKEEDNISIGYNTETGLVLGGGDQHMVAIGFAAKAYRTASIAIGGSAVAGDLVDATSRYCIAIGQGALADDEGSISIGWASDANGQNDVAIGRLAKSFESGGTAIGHQAETGRVTGSTTESSAVAIGISAKAKEYRGVSIGASSQSGATAVGTDNPDGVAIGPFAKSWEEGCIAIGLSTNSGSNGGTLNHNAVAIGTNAIAPELQSIALGSGSHGYGANSISIGQSTANDDWTIAIGLSATAGQTAGSNTENSAIAIGRSANATEIDSIAIGYFALSGQNGTSVNPRTIAIGANSRAQIGSGIALGYYARSFGFYAISIGSGNPTTGAFASESYQDRCIAIGYAARAGQSTEAGSDDAIAIGGNTNAYNFGDIAIGRLAKAGQAGFFGGRGVAIGQAAEATASNSVAIGQSCQTTLTGQVAIGNGAQPANAGEIQISVGGGQLKLTHIVISQTALTALPATFVDSPIVTLDKVWKFKINVLCRQVSTNDVAAYEFEGLIQNIAGTSTMLLAPTKTVIYEADATWDCDVVAGGVNGKLEVEITGDGVTNVTSVASMEIVEV